MTAYRGKEPKANLKELRYFNEVFKQSGVILEVSDTSRMTCMDFAVINRLVNCIKTNKKYSNNIISIGKIKGDLGMIIIRVKNGQDVQKFVEDFKFTKLMEFVKLSDVFEVDECKSRLDWYYKFGAQSETEEETKTKVEFKDVKVGDVSIGNISFEVSEEKVADSIKSSITNFMNMSSKSFMKSKNEEKDEVEETQETKSLEIPVRKSMAEIIDKMEKFNRPELTQEDVEKILEGCETEEILLRGKNLTKDSIETIKHLKQLVITNRNIKSLIVTNTGTVVYAGTDGKFYTSKFNAETKAFKTTEVIQDVYDITYAAKPHNVLEVEFYTV